MAYIVTGGAGYLGSHIVSMLTQDYSHDVIVIDDFSNGRKHKFGQKVQIIEASILSPNLHQLIRSKEKIAGIFHLAAKKSVNESLVNPALYEQVNVEGTRNILELCIKLNIPRIVFTSSAAVYGNIHSLNPIRENSDTIPINPYGETKLIGEKIVETYAEKYGIEHTTLRIFNIAGVGCSDFFDFEGGNILPILIRAYLNNATFRVLGHSLTTPDGSCVRDYSHVNDVATAHILAMLSNTRPQSKVLNVSSQNGTSVLDLIKMFESVSGGSVKTSLDDPRVGDPPSIIGDNTLARDQLAWQPQRTVLDMVSDSWNAFISPNDFNLGI